MNNLNDIAAEQFVLAGIIKYGATAYYEVLQKAVKDESFTYDLNKYIFKLLDSLLKKNDKTKFDLPIVLNEAKVLGYEFVFINNDNLNELESIFKIQIHEDNIPVLASKIKKLEIARNLLSTLKECQSSLGQVTGSESVNEILSIVESKIFNRISLLIDDQDEPQNLCEDLESYIDSRIENPVKQVGISTGFPLFDNAVGGGLRPGNLYLLGARTKVGKTTFFNNVARNICQLDIPVLHLDLEMNIDDHRDRFLSAISQVDRSIIEKGNTSKGSPEYRNIKNAIQEFQKFKYYHKSTNGLAIDVQLSIIKKWIIKSVGLNPDGTAKPCVILYDYIRLNNAADAKNWEEYQLLMFVASALQNIGIKYQVPVFAAVQLNRDGISKHDTSIISGSDRISWLCAAISFLKEKSEEEINIDNPINGNRKLYVLPGRFGEGIDMPNYINIMFNGNYAKMEEINTHFDVLKNNHIAKQSKELQKIDTESNSNNDYEF
jgi:replicative DNA helicase